MKFKLSVVKYAEENSGEAAARCFYVDPKRVRDWRKNRTELQHLSEEDSKRARLPGGGRKKTNVELEINMGEMVISKWPAMRECPAKLPYFPSLSEQDYCEEGIKCLSQIAAWSVK